MARIWMPGGGGGADLDVTTAVAGDVLKGKVIVGPDGEPLTGTLELTGNAADSQVLDGKTYYNTDAKTRRTGTMVNQGAKTSSLNCGGSYTIPAGYHNGSGKVTANSLASQTDSNAVAGELLKDKTAYVKGNKITGTMANQGAKTASLNCGGSYTIPAGYHNGSGKVTANSLASQTDATAVAGDILKDKTAWVKGSKITGNMATMAGGTYTPSTSQQTVSCNGKKMTSNIVINAIPSDYKKVISFYIDNKILINQSDNSKSISEFLAYTAPFPIKEAIFCSQSAASGYESGATYYTDCFFRKSSTAAKTGGICCVLAFNTTKYSEEKVYFTNTSTCLIRIPENSGEIYITKKASSPGSGYTGGTFVLHLLGVMGF